MRNSQNYEDNKPKYSADHAQMPADVGQLVSVNFNQHQYPLNPVFNNIEPQPINFSLSGPGLTQNLLDHHQIIPLAGQSISTQSFNTNFNDQPQNFDPPRPKPRFQNRPQAATQVKHVRQLPQPGLQHPHEQDDPTRVRRTPTRSTAPGHLQRHITTNEEDIEEDDEAEVTDRSSDHRNNNKKEPGTIADKSEEALKVLKGLKLNDQAKEVIEQQQLLIKHSQELLKLHLEQQALSEEVKRPKQVSKQTSAEEGERAELASEQRKLANSEGGSKEDKKELEESAKNKQLERPSEEPGPLESEKRRPRSKKSTSFCDNHESSDIEESPRLAETSGGSNRFKSFSYSRQAEQSSGERNSASERRQPAGLCSTSVQTSPRCSRDLSHSPTDTTDSEVEPLSRASSSRNHHRYQLRPRSKQPSSGIIRRREPTGLPPSPLPVAAAIQLHQMKQQHIKQQLKSGGAQSASSYLRSRSVTSSPVHLNHGSEYAAGSGSGYLTDHGGLRNRRGSPETLSEFGGQRRRKRLPEPPTNAVPMTPSMVRKMVQAQRALGSGPAGAKLPTSVNAQWTSLTNTHSSAFERSPARLSGADQAKPAPAVAPGRSVELAARASSATAAAGSAPAASDLNKFLSSTYGSSILKSTITDVKETPELDKLISNLDDYYNLADSSTKRHVRLAGEAAGAATSLATGARPTAPLYQPRPQYPALSCGPSSALRRNSEGEGTSLRLARRPYQALRAGSGASGSSLADCYQRLGFGSAPRTSTLVASSYPVGGESRDRPLLSSSGALRGSTLTRQSSLVHQSTSDRLRELDGEPSSSWAPRAALSERLPPGNNGNNIGATSTYSSALASALDSSQDVLEPGHGRRPQDGADLFQLGSKYQPASSRYTLSPLRHKFPHPAEPEREPSRYSWSLEHGSLANKYQQQNKWTSGVSELDSFALPSSGLSNPRRALLSSGQYGRQRSFDLDFR